jgi:hypothetical protein
MTGVWHHARQLGSLVGKSMEIKPDSHSSYLDVSMEGAQLQLETNAMLNTPVKMLR